MTLQHAHNIGVSLKYKLLIQSICWSATNENILVYLSVWQLKYLRKTFYLVYFARVVHRHCVTIVKYENELKLSQNPHWCIVWPEANAFRTWNANKIFKFFSSSSLQRSERIAPKTRTHQGKLLTLCAHHFLVDDVFILWICCCRKKNISIGNSDKFRCKPVGVIIANANRYKKPITGIQTGSRYYTSEYSISLNVFSLFIILVCRLVHGS